MELYVIDFETYYDDGYTLSKLTTEQYIRSPSFETIGVGVVRPRDGKRKFFEHGEFVRAAAKVDWSQVALLAHHAHFDGLILSHHYGITPGFWFDTLSMGNAIYGPGVSKRLADIAVRLEIGTKGDEVEQAKGKRRADFTPSEWRDYGAYCLNDADLCYQIFQKLLSRCSRVELEMIDITVRMFTEPAIELNVDLMNEYAQWERQQKEALLARVLSEDEVIANAKAKGELKDLDALKKKIFGSGDRFAQILRDRGIEPPTKETKSKKGWTYQFAKTDPFMQQLLEDPDDELRWLAEARISVKSTGALTRTERFLDCATRGPMPVYIGFAKAHTLRWGGADSMNWQNLQRVNKKKPWSGTIRRSLHAPEGYKFCVADASQIEARWTGYLGGEHWLIDAFSNSRDVYSEMASAIYNRKVDRKANPEDEFAGFVGKVCIAAGSLVLTDRGLVPIEQVQLHDRVWDGVEWVSHDGVIDQGVKDVIEVDGLCGTPDHIVYTRQGRKIRLCEAAEAVQAGEGLAITEVDGRPVRVGEGDWTDSPAERLSSGTLRVHELRHQEAHRCEQPIAREDAGMSVLFTDYFGSRGSVGAAIRRDQSPMHEPEASAVEKLRRAGHTESVPNTSGVYQVRGDPSAAPRLQRGGDRPGGQQRSLRAGELAAGDAQGKLEQPEVDQIHVVRGRADSSSGRVSRTEDGRPRSAVRAADSKQTGPNAHSGTDDSSVLHARERQAKRVYDIANAGPRHRFTVSGHLVSNCVLGFGFGMGWYKAAMSFLAGPMGADPVIFGERDYDIIQPNGHAFMSNPKKVEQVRAMPSRLPLRERFIHCIVTEEIVKRWRAKNPAIAGKHGLWKHMEQILAWMTEGVEVDYGKCGFAAPIPFRVGRHEWQLEGFCAMHFNGLEFNGQEYTYLGGKSGRERVRIHGPAATENIIQYLARCTTGGHMAQYRRETQVPIKMMAHDEVVSLPRTENSQAALALKLQIMKTSPAWAPGLPLNAEGAIGDVYGEIK